jgi:hypothetical protein
MRLKRLSLTRNGNLRKVLLAQGLLLVGLSVPKALGGSVGERTAVLGNSGPVAVLESSGVALSYLERAQRYDTNGFSTSTGCPANGEDFSCVEAGTFGIHATGLRDYALTSARANLSPDPSSLARNGGFAPATILKAGLMAPEPAMLAVFGGGLISVALFFRRRPQRGNSAWSNRASLETQSNPSKLSFELPSWAKNFLQSP